MKETSLQNRSCYHDLLRIFASIAVICIHVCAESETWTDYSFSSPVWTVLNVFDSISRFAVPVFVMLSGSFMLDKYQEGALKKLYSKNILRLVCAFVFWSTIYVVVELSYQLRAHNPPDIKALLYLFIQGEYHLWFIPMLAFLYIVTPLLKELCKNKQNEQYFICLACVPIIFNFIKYFVTIYPLVELYNNAGFQFVSGYTAYYILGHYLTKNDTSKRIRILVYLSAIISLIATVFVSHWHYNAGHISPPYVYEYLSPTVLIVSIAIFLLFKLGLRIGELVALKWEDIDTDSMEIHIHRMETYETDADGNRI